MVDHEFREIEREREDRLADEAGVDSSERAKERALFDVFKTYDPAKIAAAATSFEIEEAYATGIIGPAVAARAQRLREER